MTNSSTLHFTECLLSNETFVCSRCGKACSVEDGTWPKYNGNEPQIIWHWWNANTEDDYLTEFECYDCCE